MTTAPMQATNEADESGQHLRGKGDDDAINFRPSTNFKYMKKYCKGKVEQAMAELNAHEEEREVHPPLPREPPPPDSSPPAELITPKVEPEEEEYAPGTEAEAPANNQNRIMCRQYARGACTRGASCIYVHEIILSQLPGIYTFCRDFQNSTCTFARCKFVHATVFEKEYFYRSGFLPPHTLKHLKENAVTAQPPPHAHHALHPHHPIVEGGAPEPPAPAAFPNPASAALPQIGAAVAGASCSSAEVLPEPRAAASSALKRDYRDVVDRCAKRLRLQSEYPDFVLGTPSVLCHNTSGTERSAGTALAKCGHCDIVNFKIQCQQNKTEKLKRSIKELQKKTAEVNCKNNRQMAVLLALFKHPAGGDLLEKTAGISGANLINFKFIQNEAKQKAIIEKLTMVFSPTLHSASAENTKKVNKTMNSLLMQLLMTAMEDPKSNQNGNPE